MCGVMSGMLALFVVCGHMQTENVVDLCNSFRKFWHGFLYKKDRYTISSSYVHEVVMHGYMLCICMSVHGSRGDSSAQGMGGEYSSSTPS